MSVFDTILSNRNIQTAPVPFWRLKVTDEEYKQLRAVLRDKAKHCLYNCPYNPFAALWRECALYFSEWFRRENVGGKKGEPSVLDVFESLGKDLNENLAEDFYNAACTIFKKNNGGLYIKPIKTSSDYNYKLASLFFQGGLPMAADGTWNQRLKALLYKNVNIDAILQGQKARQSASIRKFCQALRVAIYKRNMELMPFEVSKDVFERQYLQIGQEMEIKRSAQDPFDILFLCQIDTYSQQFCMKYKFIAPQSLDSDYANEKISRDTFDVYFKYDDNQVNRLTYYKCKTNSIENTIRNYHVENDEDGSLPRGSMISIEASNGTTLVQADYNFDTPHIFKKSAEGAGFYELANAAGRSSDYERVIIAPNSWRLVGSDDHEIYNCYNGGGEYRLWFIPSGDTRSLILERIACGVCIDKIDFSPNEVLSWIEIVYKKSNKFGVITNLDDVTFYRTDDLGCPDEVSPKDLIFRSPYSQHWSKEPQCGKLYVSCRDEETGCLVTPTEILYVGPSFTYEENAGRDDYSVLLNWTDGRCRLPQGRLAEESENRTRWTISKKDLKEPFDITVQFTPHGSLHPFSVKLHSPFRGLYFFRPRYGEYGYVEIRNHEVIPMSLLSSCIYQIEGDAGFTVRLPDLEHSAKSVGSRDCIDVKDSGDNPIAKRPVKPRGYFSMLLNKEYLDGKNEINVKLGMLYVTFKERPFRIYKRRSEEFAFVTDATGRFKIDFKGSFKFLPFYQPNWAKAVTDIYEGRFVEGTLSETILTDGSIGYTIPTNQEHDLMFYPESDGIVRPQKFRFGPDISTKPKAFESQEQKKERENTNYEKIMSELFCACQKGEQSEEWSRTLYWFEVFCRTQVRMDLALKAITSGGAWSQVLTSCLALYTYLNRKKVEKFWDAEKFIEDMRRFSLAYKFDWKDYYVKEISTDIEFNRLMEETLK